MKRFILYSLSATMAVAVGSVARAAETNTMGEAQIDGNLLAQSIDDTYGEGEVHQFEYRSSSLVGGILSPDDSGPNNRALPTTRSSDMTEDGMFDEVGLRQSDTMMDREDGYPTEGTILSPDDQGPNNRAEPTPNP